MKNRWSIALGATRALMTMERIMERSVAAMSERNSFVNGEMLAGVSFSRELRRLPAVVLAAW